MTATMEKKMNHGTAAQILKDWIGAAQLQVLGKLCYGEERQYFIDLLIDLAKRVKGMPKIYEQDGKGEQAIVYLHYFTSGFDWYITERDFSNEQLQAFGYADLGYGLEAGYICIPEILKHGAEIDLHWTLKRVVDL